MHHLDISTFLEANLLVINAMIDDIWDEIRWIEKPIVKKKKIPPYKQKRILPVIPEYSFKKAMRAKYLEGWIYSAHWIDSDIKTAFSIIKSWQKNYANGNRKARKPVVKRNFVRLKQTLFKLDGDTLRISIKPREFLHVDLSKRYFKTGDKLGEPILCEKKIYLPFHYPDPVDTGKRIAWDSNVNSIDGFSPELGWIKISLKPVHAIHEIYHEKYKNINRVYAKNKNLGKKLYARYRRRERERLNQYLHLVAKEVIKLGAIHGFEKLKKQGMFKNQYHDWNRMIADSDWRKLVKYVASRSRTRAIQPWNTSKTCSRCGYTIKDLRGAHVFTCPRCCLNIDRQFNAAINLYLRMNGASHDVDWFDTTIHRGGLPAMWVEMSLPDELARDDDELMKPKVHVRVSMIT